MHCKPVLLLLAAAVGVYSIPATTSPMGSTEVEATLPPFGPAPVSPLSWSTTFESVATGSSTSDPMVTPFESVAAGTASTQWCDGGSVLYCTIGTCYTGVNNYVGCCTVPSCAARSECFDYNTGAPDTSIDDCDQDKDGCIRCYAEAPACVLISNWEASQFAYSCAAEETYKSYSYKNPVTASASPAPAPTTTPTGASSGASSTSAVAGTRSSIVSRTGSTSASASTLSSAASSTSASVNSGVPLPTGNQSTGTSSSPRWRRYTGIGASVGVGGVVIIVAIISWLWHRGSKQVEYVNRNGNWVRTPQAVSWNIQSIARCIRAGLQFGQQHDEPSNSGEHNFELLRGRTYVPSHGSYNSTPLTNMSPLADNVEENRFLDLEPRSGTPEEPPRPTLRLLNPDIESSAESLSASHGGLQKDIAVTSGVSQPENPVVNRSEAPAETHKLLDYGADSLQK